MRILVCLAVLLGLATADFSFPVFLLGSGNPMNSLDILMANINNQDKIQKMAALAIPDPQAADSPSVGVVCSIPGVKECALFKCANKVCKVDATVGKLTQNEAIASVSITVASMPTAMLYLDGDQLTSFDGELFKGATWKSEKVTIGQFTLAPSDLEYKMNIPRETPEDLYMELNLKAAGSLLVGFRKDITVAYPTFVIGCSTKSDKCLDFACTKDDACAPVSPTKLTMNKVDLKAGLFKLNMKAADAFAAKEKFLLVSTFKDATEVDMTKDYPKGKTLKTQAYLVNNSSIIIPTLAALSALLLIFN